ncbi:PucR family transcriptional regulator [Nocardia terrae]|uniref:PucR family transcriptional regulator n=1 Tax=Nocardia terrae TaxID=2675851 RepID=UPI0012F7962F|nr:helix-turn-helix domain-containing protein [Nocardia terrae]
MTDARTRAALTELRTAAHRCVDTLEVTSPEPGDVTAVGAADFLTRAHLHVDLLFALLIDGTDPADTALAPIVEAARASVGHGRTLEEVLDIRLGAIEHIWRQLLAAADEPTRRLLSDQALALSRYNAIVSTRVAVACADFTAHPRWEQLERRHDLADALLTGRYSVGMHADPTIRLAEKYLVVVARAADPAPRTVGNLRLHFPHISTALVRADAGGWTALLPLDSETDAATATSELERRVRPIRDTLPRFWLGVSASPVPGLPEAFVEARTLAELGRGLDSVEIVCRREQFMVEYAIAADSQTRMRLAHVLDALDEQPILAETYDVFVRNNYALNPTADALHIHRNTVTYRLTRITDLTGYDPQNPTEAMTLAAARTARLLQRANVSTM